MLTITMILCALAGGWVGNKIADEWYKQLDGNDE